MGSLNKILPKALDKETEDIALDKIKSEMTSAISLYINAIRAIEEEYSKEAVEKIHQNQMRRTVELGKELRSSVKDNRLKAFCYRMEQSCAGTHEWEKLEDTETRQAYRFTRCMWAEIYRSLDAEDIGFWICEGDGPAAAAFNPEIKFKRTKTLMDGDEYCDHVFYIEEE